ncbi:hypothetical protein [Nocardia sp. NPDC052566]|uniref:hypothetical protein n=1 Tax=Nocardia sp. NPDC052566 TaxID=3364330 RepID=UPI0037CCC34C
MAAERSDLEIARNRSRHLFSEFLMSLIIVSGVLAFVPSGMTKNGTQAMPTDWAQITGWTADVGNYPGSVVVPPNNSGLKALGTKQPASIAAAVKFTGASEGWGGVTTLRVRVRVNSTVVAASDPINGPDGTLLLNTPANIAEGDVVTVECMATVQSGGQAGTISSGATTYLRIL